MRKSVRGLNEKREVVRRTGRVKLRPAAPRSLLLRRATESQHQFLLPGKDKSGPTGVVNINRSEYEAGAAPTLQSYQDQSVNTWWKPSVSDQATYLRCFQETTDKMVWCVKFLKTLVLPFLATLQEKSVCRTENQIFFFSPLFCAGLQLRANNDSVI